MIDVPVRVKDALRDGRLRKNYKFYIDEPSLEYFSVGTITAYNYNKTVTSIVTLMKAGKVRLESEGYFQNATVSYGGTLTYFASVQVGDKYVAEIPSVSINAYVGVDGVHKNDSITVDVYEQYSDEYIVDDSSFIDNNNIVMESVKFDERMCSGSELKFGLCEGSSLEFQYFNFHSILGRRIRANIQVQYEDEYGDLTWYTIPMGYYIVEQCPMQFSTGIRKVTAYNKLRSSWLDQAANLYINSLFGDLDYVPFYSIRNALTNRYQQYELDSQKTEVSPDTETPLTMRVTGSTYTLIGVGNYTPFCYIHNGSASKGGNYVYACSNKYEYTLDPIKVYTISFPYGDIREYEEKYYTYLQETLPNALTNGSTGANDILSKMINNTHSATGYDPYDGCYEWFGAVVTYNDDSTEIYSTHAYNNGKYSARDTLRALTLSIITGAKKLTVYWPTMFALTDTSPAVIGNGGFGTAPFWHMSQVRYGLNGITMWLYFPWLFPNGETSSIWDGGQVREGWDMGEAGCGLFFCPVKVYENVLENSADLIQVQVSSLADISAREAISSVYELSVAYGKLDRQTDMFSSIDLNGSRLLPADNLYPADTLYPNGNSARANKSMYQKLWTDSQGNQKFRYLYITYKGLDANNQEVEKVLQRTVNADGTTDYNMSDNWLFKNLVWSDADVGDYADAMVLKMKDISWFPFEMWCAGLPYIETGDELEITNSEGTYTSYVLQRQLNGIQNLQDTFIDGELDIF